MHNMVPRITEYLLAMERKCCSCLEEVNVLYDCCYTQFRVFSRRFRCLCSFRSQTITKKKSEEVKKKYLNRPRKKSSFSFLPLCILHFYFFFSIRCLHSLKSQQITYFFFRCFALLFVIVSQKFYLRNASHIWSKKKKTQMKIFSWRYRLKPYRRDDDKVYERRGLLGH